MLPEITLSSPILLVGLSVRTSYTQELSAATSKIGPLFEQFFSEGIPSKILSKTAPQEFIIAYTDYENNYRGGYTCFIGQEISSSQKIDPSLKMLVIPTQRYMHLEVGPGPIPEISIKGWQNIWDMKEAELGGLRTYKVDFERHALTPQAPQAQTVDIFVGIEPHA